VIIKHLWEYRFLVLFLLSGFLIFTSLWLLGMFGFALGYVLEEIDMRDDNGKV